MAKPQAVSGSAPKDAAPQSGTEMAREVAPLLTEGSSAAPRPTTSGSEAPKPVVRKVGESLDEAIDAELAEIKKAAGDGSGEGGGDGATAEAEAAAKAKAAKAKKDAEDAGEGEVGEGEGEGKGKEKGEGEGEGEESEEKTEESDILPDDSPAFKARMDKVLQRENALKEIASEQEAELAEIRPKVQFSEEWAELLPVDPVLRAMFESTWYGQKRLPKLADYVNALGPDGNPLFKSEEEAHAVFEAVHAKVREIKSRAEEARTAKETETLEQYADALEAEEASLRKSDPVFKQLTPDEVDAIYKFIIDQQRPQRGRVANKYRWNFREAAHVALGAKVFEKYQAVGKEAAVETQRKKERALGLVPRGGAPPAGKPVDRNKLDFEEDLNLELQDLKTGT